MQINYTEDDFYPSIVLTEFNYFRLTEDHKNVLRSALSMIRATGQFTGKTQKVADDLASLNTVNDVVCGNLDINELDRDVVQMLAIEAITLSAIAVNVCEGNQGYAQRSEDGIYLDYPMQPLTTVNGIALDNPSLVCSAIRNLSHDLSMALQTA